MKRTLLFVAVLHAVSSLPIGSMPVAYAHEQKPLGQGRLLPPGHGEDPREPDRYYAPGQSQGQGGHCHGAVQRHLHNTYSHPADHYHRRGDCQPVIT